MQGSNFRTSCQIPAPQMENTKVMANLCKHLKYLGMSRFSAAVWFIFTEPCDVAGKRWNVSCFGLRYSSKLNIPSWGYMIKHDCTEGSRRYQATFHPPCAKWQQRAFHGHPRPFRNKIWKLFRSSWNSEQFSKKVGKSHWSEVHVVLISTEKSWGRKGRSWYVSVPSSASAAIIPGNRSPNPRSRESGGQPNSITIPFVYALHTYIQIILDTRGIDCMELYLCPYPLHHVVSLRINLQVGNHVMRWVLNHSQVRFVTCTAGVMTPSPSIGLGSPSKIRSEPQQPNSRSRVPFSACFAFPIIKKTVWGFMKWVFIQDRPKVATWWFGEPHDNGMASIPNSNRTPMSRGPDKHYRKYIELKHPPWMRWLSFATDYLHVILSCSQNAEVIS